MADLILIDDNSKKQRELYGASFIDNGKYDGLIDHYEHFNDRKDLSFLSNAKCVFFHDSLEDYINGAFNEHSHKAKEKIQDYIEDNSIRYVCFSDGHVSVGDYDDSGNIVQLKKSAFYDRLESFLKFYQENKILQLHILAYGKDYNKELMMRYVRAMCKKLSSKSPYEIVTWDDIKYFIGDKGKDKSGFLEETVKMSQPALGMDYNDIIDYIEDEEITVKEFVSRLNQILKSFSLYGKNTYTWK